MSHQGKNYAITGAGSGMGAASAIKAATSGVAGLLLADLNDENLKNTVAECELTLSPAGPDFRKRLTTGSLL
jgi:NAD(P)-dependent dehydrogenase (short-subunit alcohol dehydrogenase family)